MNPSDLTYTAKVREYIEVEKVVRPVDEYGTDRRIVNSLNSALSAYEIVGFRPPIENELFFTAFGSLEKCNDTKMWAYTPRLILRPRLYAHDILGAAPAPEEKP